MNDLNAKDRLTFLEQQMQVMRGDFNKAMQETGQLFQKLIAMNRTYQAFVEERLQDVEKHLGFIPPTTSDNISPSSVKGTDEQGTPDTSGDEDLS